MALVINHNLMAMNSARNLSDHYGALSTSTQRLSSGLRINSAADDAAGLAVRELMRSDISTMNQGIRNANDAISMIQTADGALQVVDEKLIRMKELAEQAATGTYTEDQRAIINSEFQAMALEVQRISNATDFNGIPLLNGNLSGISNTSSLSSSGSLIVHFGTSNNSAEDYYSVSIDDSRLPSLFSNANLVGSVLPDSIPMYEPEGSSKQVNTFTTGDQEYPSLTSIEGGNFLSVWQSQNQGGAGWSIHGQIMDTNGNKVGSEFQVNTYNISDQTQPKTTTLGNGNLLVTWASNGQDGSGLGVYGQVLQKDGSKIGSEFRLNSTTPNDQQTSIQYVGNPLVALDDNRFAAVWSSDLQGGAGSNTIFRIFDNEGNPLTNESIVSDYPNGSNIIPSITKLTNGNTIVTYSGGGGGGPDPSSYGIYSQEYDTSGAKVGNNILVNDYTTNVQNWSSVQSLSDGKYVVAWSSFDQESPGSWGTYAKIYNQDGTVYKSEFKVNDATINDQHMPVIADLKNGAFIVSYNSGGFDGKIGWAMGAQIFGYNGTKLGNEFMVNSELAGNQSNPAITALDDGSFAIAYNNDAGEDPSGIGISVRIYQPFLDIRTQTRAQEHLEKISSALIKKDKIRANLGATQNRLENTVSNIQIQAENLQAAESQISDTDVADEMTNFVKEQILSQAAVAMLSQANSLPKMALQLIEG
ncbi:flagellin [Solidesulfovibrio magneticus RS-1]|uniref:Flagellin n=1 Tax=Solidesulfovibrio magneticus (strain ATCC 700980 / DSM 13731 / RS-1) TaxID=573370 RepID=C4XKY0_SOLM1|nr:flagellin [Solidesulfovibrio magneticus RS-1]